MSLVRLAILLGYSYAVTAAVLVQVGSKPIPSRQDQPRNAPTELALEVLGSSERLYSAQVGYAGLNPPQVLAWRVLLISPHADSLFLELMNRAGRPGQLYALAGLRWLREYGRLDPKLYRAALRRLRAGRVDEMILTQIGCVGGAQSLESLLAEINSGIWSRELLTGRLQH